jgi:hypothetical protein
MVLSLNNSQKHSINIYLTYHNYSSHLLIKISTRKMYVKGMLLHPARQRRHKRICCSSFTYRRGSDNRFSRCTSEILSTNSSRGHLTSFLPIKCPKSSILKAWYMLRLGQPGTRLMKMPLVKIKLGHHHFYLIQET